MILGWFRSARDFSSLPVVGGSAGASAQDRSAARRQQKQGYGKWMWVKMEDLGDHRCECLV